jgi:hypothetical protein
VSEPFWYQHFSSISIFLVSALYEGLIWTGEPRANDEGGVEGAKIALRYGTLSLVSQGPGDASGTTPAESLESVQVNAIAVSYEEPRVKPLILAKHIKYFIYRGSGVKKGSRGTDRIPEDCYIQLEAFLIIGVDFYDAMPRL